MPRFIAALILCLLFAGLSGCGNKGPLILPSESADETEETS